MTAKEIARQAVARWREDPVLFVREALGEEPDEWQVDALMSVRDNPRTVMSACKGPGKSKLLNWIIWWMLFCFVDSQTMALSITADNLRDTLWKELAATHARVDILRETFDFKAEAIRRKTRPRTWWCVARAFAQSADKEQQANTLAGFHGQDVMVIMDEAGDIPVGVLVAADAIFANAANARIVMAGNPTSRQGALGQAVLKDRQRWNVIYITGDPDDPKRSPRISLQWARDMIALFGAENPWVLVNVFGRFPATGPSQLIPDDSVLAAQQRDVPALAYRGEARVWGVDPGRFGDDEQVLCRRQGLLVRPMTVYRNQDGVQLAEKIWELVQQEEMKGEAPDAIFVDVGGTGSSCFDTLVRCTDIVHAIDFGSAARSPERYANKRTEMWFDMAAWVNKRPCCLPTDPVLSSELPAPTFAFRVVNKSTTFILESKEQMKERGVPSPNRGDALALTFAGPVNPNSKEERHRQALLSQRCQTEYADYSR